MPNSISELLISSGVIQEFSACGAHVAYEGGKIHSDFAFNINQLLRTPKLLEQSVGELISRVPDLSRAKRVCSYFPYGDQLAAVVGEMLNLEASVLETATGRWTLGMPQVGEACLIIADDVLTGGRVEKLTNSIQELGAMYLQPVLVMANLSTAWSPSFRVEALVNRSIPLWTQAECPLCKAGSPPRRRVELTS